MTNDRDAWPPEGYVIFDDHPTSEVLARAVRDRSVVCSVILFSRTDDIHAVRDAWLDAHPWLESGPPETRSRLWVCMVPEAIGLARGRGVFSAIIYDEALFHVVPLDDRECVVNLLLSDEVAGHDPPLQPWNFKTLEGCP